MKAINPVNGKLIKEYKEHTDEEAAKILEAMHTAWRTWRDTSFAERSTLMHKAADVLRQHKERYAQLMTDEMGKPITQSRAEIEKCAWVCDFYADEAESMLADEPAESDGKDAFVRFQPLGIVLAVMPWNYPHWQVWRFAAPALMAGNVGVLKHASNVPGTALAIEEVFTLAGFPKDVFRTLLIGSKQVEKVIRHGKVRAVTLTGSEQAGSLVASQAGSEIKRTVLELGGSDPFIVLDDVDVDRCALQAVNGRMLNTGQSCIAAKRFIVLKEVAKDFRKKYIAFMEAQRLGDPRDPETQVGPLAKEQFVNDIDALVQDAVKKGAKLLTGGKRAVSDGYYYEPTLLTDVTPDMRIYHEEAFGPVAVLYEVKDDDEAVAVANATRFGLGASVWSRDVERALKVADRLEAGAVFVNGIVKSDPRLPFGGVKKSGYGRELSHYGIKEFCNIKTYWVGEGK